MASLHCTGPTALNRACVGVASSSNLLCRSSWRLSTLHRRKMLSDTLQNFSIPISTGPYYRKQGIPARVAQFRQVTGSGDSSHDLPDLEFGQQAGGTTGPQQQQPNSSSSSTPLHSSSAAAAAAGSSGSNGSSNADHALVPGEQLVEAVSAEIRRQRFEALYESSSDRLVQTADGSSRDFSSPADDEQLPLLADLAARPMSAAERSMASIDAASSQHTSSSHTAVGIPAAAAAAAPAAAGAATAAAAAAEAGPAMIGGGIPHSIFVLSMVSMALTSASCVFNTLLPIYMVTELKMTMRAMGMFEGMLEAFSYVVRMFSGVISDKMTSRKAAITAGFAMGAAAKFGMSGATTTIQLFVTKAMDRLGNGVQAAPRDALIGDLSPVASRSACFGFAQSMRKWGSFMGAGLAFALMKASGNNYRAIFLLAAGVSALSTLAFVLCVPSHPTKSAADSQALAKSPTPDPQQQQQQQPMQQDKQSQQLLRLRTQQQAAAGGLQAQQQAGAATGRAPQQQQQQQPQGQPLLESVAQFWRDVCSMGVDFYRTLSVIALYGLGHINESLLEARAIEVGFGKAESTLVVALLCFSVFLCAYPMGRLDDKYGHATTFALGMASLVAGDLVLLTSGNWPAAVFVACGFWGVHWAVVQGPMLSAVVGMAPPHLKGTAFGIFYTMMAVVAVIANTMFGSIWHAHSATAAFALSALLITVTMVLTPFLLPASAKVPRKGRATDAGTSSSGGSSGSSGTLKPAAA